MEEENKFSRQRFLKKLTATSVAVTASLRNYASTPEQVNSKASYSMTPLSKSEDKKFVPVMITPFLENSTIDFNGLSALIDFYLAAGVKGFFANCLSSEMYQLDERERLALTRHVVNRVNGAVPVVATGSFGLTMNERVEFAKKINQTGIAAVILITSHYASKEESDDVLLANIERMLELTGTIPMGLYECPSPYKRIVSPEVFKSLLKSNRFVYHKDTSIDREKIKAKLALLKNSQLEFYDAHTANTVFSLQHGAKGMSAISGNFYPEILVWMCNHVNNPQKQEEVKWLQTELEKTEELISKAYPMSSKYFLKKRGVPVLPVSRSSAQPLTTQQIKTLDEVHQTFLGWCERLGIQEVTLK
jgi:4-hydroxy-tetrahydrodipicolinate synthase